MSTFQLPIFKAPQRVDWENDPDPIAKMKDHLQTAVTLELHTVPLYLFALYSVEEGHYDAAKSIKKVSAEEMLHLGLAGNILCSIGGTPKLYGKDYTPEYPVKIFDPRDGVQLNLRGTTTANLETFVKLEAPTPPTIDILKVVERNLIPEYRSIAEFYKSIDSGLKILHARHGDKLFRRAPLARQFKPGDGSHKQMISIDSLASAQEAMQLIIIQGEGSHLEFEFEERPLGEGGPVVKRSSESLNQGEGDNHYQIFRRLRDAGVPHHNVVEDPKTESFKDSGKPFYKAMVACDAAYCYLLSTIEILWTYNGPKRKDIIKKNMGPLMHVIEDISEYLVKQDVGNGKKAAPCFNLYDRSDLLPRLEQLKRETDAAVEAIKELKDKEINKKVDGLVDVFNLNTGAMDNIDVDYPGPYHVL